MRINSSCRTKGAKFDTRNLPKLSSDVQECPTTSSYNTKNGPRFSNTVRNFLLKIVVIRPTLQSVYKDVVPAVLAPKDQVNKMKFPGLKTLQPRVQWTTELENFFIDELFVHEQTYSGYRSQVAKTLAMEDICKNMNKRFDNHVEFNAYDLARWYLRLEYEMDTNLDFKHERLSKLIVVYSQFKSNFADCRPAVLDVKDKVWIPADICNQYKANGWWEVCEKGTSYLQPTDDDSDDEPLAKKAKTDGDAVGTFTVD